MFENVAVNLSKVLNFVLFGTYTILIINLLFLGIPLYSIFTVLIKIL